MESDYWNTSHTVFTFPHLSGESKGDYSDLKNAVGLPPVFAPVLTPPENNELLSAKNCPLIVTLYTLNNLYYFAL